MFHLHYDTHPELLADRLAGLLARREAADLLRPQTVLVPQKGLERWLVQRLAERHGIAANLEFIAPAQMVWRVLRALHRDLPPHSRFDREALVWRLLDLLEHLPAREPAVAALVEDDPQPLRRFQLATHLAQLFERYQAYRRDLLEGWQRGEEPGDAQAVLWRALVEGTPELPRSRLLGDFLQRYSNDDANAPPDLPARLFAFGCINVSPDVLRFMGILGRHAELHFFLPTPCREYWGDIPRRRDAAAQLREHGGGYFDQPANPLLVSMGGLGRDFVAQVFGYDEVQPDIETFAEDVEPSRDTLLHCLQADVITLQAAEAGEDMADPAPDDDSLQVHVCHSPMREVEVLHDRLLDLFQRHEDLEPRDVAVMVPNLGIYAPCVDAVFGALSAHDPRFIPWTVADRPASQAHALSAMFLNLLDMPASRLGLEEVLDVLAVPAVSRAHGLDGADLEALRELAASAGICRDEDAGDREAQGLPACHEFSWAFGRERLLLGYLLGHDADADADLAFDIAPLTDIEGDRAIAMGQLLRIQRLLRQWRGQARQAHTPTSWQRLLNRLMDALVPDTDERDEARALESIRAALAALGDGETRADYTGTLDWRCVRDFLRGQLAEATTHQRFLAGGVSVCGMVPLRNVPFRVICMLGLDAASFPRQDPADAMSRLYADALADHRRLGDRSTREDDRYLFLQTLMAARDVLHLSYVGIHPRDGSRIEPSVLVSELLDTIGIGYFADAETARAALVVTHPMQPFSRRLFDGGDARLFTYRHEWLAAAQTASGQARPPRFADVAWPADDVSARVDLADLQQFFGAPQRYFLRQRVGLAIADMERNGTDREPLVDDAMTRAIRERGLLDRLLHDDLDIDTTRHWSRAHGLLPPLALGEKVHADSFEEVAPQARIWRSRAGGELPPELQVFELALPSGRVVEGRLPHLDQAGMASWIGNANNAKNWMHWWLEALSVRARDGSAACLAFGCGNDHVPMPLAPCMPSSKGAATLLDTLLDLYREGQTRPLPLPPRSGWAWIRDMVTRTNPDEDKALGVARKVWENESADPWIATALRGADPLADPRFTELALEVYGPLWDALQTGVRP
ncbi:MAG TPA: exodeoxyribonuclease V subunit gamma [Rhodanobacteraceae bacterium]|nr:exodeoxyribonuclease V subunit gamma [Rhodanobacteraceae bacterium]